MQWNGRGILGCKARQRLMKNTFINQIFYQCRAPYYNPQYIPFNVAVLQQFLLNLYDLVFTLHNTNSFHIKEYRIELLV